MSRPYAPVAAGVYPQNDCPAYRSSAKRAPQLAPIALPQGAGEIQGPRYGKEMLRAGAADMTTAVAGGSAQGQRIVVHGQVVDEYGRPERDALIEVWQANAAGRYLHPGDQHDAPLDPYFTGAGQVVTDAEGRYRLLTIAPGAYPWGNHYNAWRPRHIHFSLFGQAWASRLVTQMYFAGDPLLALDPIFMALPAAEVRERLLAVFDREHTEPDFALAYRFDIVLRGPAQTPWERQR